MATTTGSEYDHITISDGTDQVVHYLKDTVARTDLGDLQSAKSTIINTLNKNKVNIIYPQWESGYLNEGTESASAKSIRTGFIPVQPNSIIHADGIEAVYSAGVFGAGKIEFYSSAKSYISSSYMFYDNSGTMVYNHSHLARYNIAYIRLLLNSSANIVNDSSKELLTVTYDSVLQELKYKEMHHGVGEADLIFNPDISSRYSDIMFVERTSKTTYLYQMPKDGISLYHTDYITGEVLRFFKLENTGEIVSATDYEGYVNTSSAAFGNWVGYYPYAEGVYFTIVVGASTDTDLLHVVSGHVTDNGGRMPNLSLCSLFGKRKNGSTSKANQYLDIFEYWNWNHENSNGVWLSNLEGGYTNAYCSIMPLYAVRSVTVAPPYTMVARVYKIDNDNKTAEIDQEIFGHVIYSDGDAPHRYVSGLYYIDFSEYDYDGIVLIGITSPFKKMDNVLPFKATTGMLNSYDDVYNSVFVEWKSGINVNYESGIPAICKKNIDTIKRTASFVNLQESLTDGGYGNWNVLASNKMHFFAYDNCTGWWYNGTNTFNGPHMHVNPKSYITASKNQHSRVYVPTHPSIKYLRSNNLYGSVCSSTSSMVCGFNVGNETLNYCSELVDNFTYKELNGIESLTPGDLFACGTFTPDSTAEKGSYGHVVFITEKVSINGEVWCVNTFEGSQPWTQCRTLINYGAYNGYVGETTHEDNEYDIDIFDYYSFQKYVDKYVYHKIARPSVSLLHTIRDAYGPYDVQDYAVTNIMCDRGTDSVYCAGEYMTLTVTDSTSSFDLYKDNSKIKTVTLADYPSHIFSNATNYVVCGTYSIDKCDIESGTWSFSTKGVNSKRLRINQLNPIVSGTKIKYLNPTKYIRFGVLATKTATAYAQLSDWIGPSDNVGEYTIDNNGYLVFLVKKDSAESQNISVSDYDIKASFSITDMFSADGYYQIKAGDTVKESWFVPEERYIDCSWNSTAGTATVTFDPSEENDEVVAIAIEYWNGDDGTIRPVYEWQSFDATTVDGSGHCTYVGEYAPSFCDNVTRTPLSASVLRRTPYGTYQVKKFNYASANYLVRQRAGLMIDAEDG